ncbi:MAG: c-type cytochrome, partial [Proteobacteria bacterium]|nr:c-type cytochrome [Pseudomonadota bacterium]
TALTGMLVVSGSAWADANLDLAKSKQCLSCHAADKTATAPSFKAIADKYRKNPGAEAALENGIMKGWDAGGYHVGITKMPSPGPRPAVSKSEAKQLAGWILGQK